jgi:predicted PurR-regulated permease PerM
MNQNILNKRVIVILAFVISIVFVAMIKNFIMVLLLAAIFSALFQRLYKRLNIWFKGKSNLSSLFTLLLILLIFILPLLGISGIVAGQAYKISQTVKPWVETQLANPNSADELFSKLPYSEKLLEHKEAIYQKAGEFVGKLGNVVMNQLSNVTVSTANFLFMVFVFFYSMFFFLKDGSKILQKILFYLPMKHEEEMQLLDRFISVSRATLKGTLLIGLIQGSIAGIAFWIAGIESALFWTVLMVILSIIPAIGSALIWLPAVIILFATGEYGNAIFLLLFCGIIVGSIDNFLRPKFVGKDTKMHELMIFLGTLGGISLFGILGFIIGPIIAALFVTIWEIYGNTFKDSLPEIKAFSQDASLKETKLSIPKILKKSKKSK